MKTEGNVNMPVNVNSYTQRILANISVNLAVVQPNIASPDTPLELVMIGRKKGPVFGETLVVFDTP